MMVIITGADRTMSCYHIDDLSKSAASFILELGIYRLSKLSYIYRWVKLSFSPISLLFIKDDNIARAISKSEDKAILSLTANHEFFFSYKTKPT